MINLRRAEAHDAEAIFEIEKACFSVPWSMEAIETELAETDQRMYMVIEVDDKVIGYAGAWLVLDEGQITNIAIAPEYRRDGYGAMMTRKLIRELFKKGMNEIFLEVRISNVAALTMYRRLGFTVKGLRKGYYTDPVEDAYIMSLIKEEEPRYESIYLAIESSCDETSAAVLVNGRQVLSNVISSQVPIHQKFGGVVPEIASRHHIEQVIPVVDQALADAGVTLTDINHIGVTYGPGLVGSLLVGVAAAKGLSFATDIPLIGVHHMEGHIFANFLAHPDLEPPFLSLVVSGGHTMLVVVKDYETFEVLGQTRDDAAGEAFDKIARVMGYPYPGGPQIERVGADGNPTAIEFPKALQEKGNFEFSFSGLKSAVLNYLNSAKQKGEAINEADVAASFQQAIIDVLVEKTIERLMLRGKLK